MHARTKASFEMGPLNWPHDLRTANKTHYSETDLV